jgi:hypothetical protein
MKTATPTISRIALAGLFVLSLLATVALAGPPLICHPFEIDGANSLPWISHDWNLSGSESYNTSNLATDTIAILDSNQTVLVHMETLRRATLYAKKDPLAAKQLIVRIVTRSEAAQSPAQAKSLALFDAGYLTEAYKQWLGDQTNPARSLDGYALVQKAIQLRGNDPQMEFAAALISVSSPSNDQRDHAQKAMAGAKSDPLLARNLSTHFIGANSQTMAEVIGRTKTVKE